MNNITIKAIMQTDPNSKNTPFEVDEKGTYISEDNKYTGPQPNVDSQMNQLPKANPPIIEDTHQKNTSYEVDENGTYLDDTNTYSGPRPNESEKAKNAQKMYEVSENEKQKHLEKVLKRQSKLRHAGY